MQTINKYKKQIIISIIIILLIIVLAILTINSKQKQQNQEIQDYIPAEEMSQEQLRKTIVSLYFPQKEQAKIKKI